MTPAVLLLFFLCSALLLLLPWKERFIHIGFFSMALLDAMAVLALAVPHLQGGIVTYAPLALFKVDMAIALCLLAFATVFMLVSLSVGLSWMQAYKDGTLSRVTMCCHMVAFFLCSFFLLLTLLTDALPMIIIGMVGVFVTGIVHGVRVLSSPDWKSVERCIRLCGIGLLFVMFGYGVVSTATFLIYGEWMWTYTLLAGAGQSASAAIDLIVTQSVFMKLGFLLSSIGLLLVAGLVPFFSVFLERHRVFSEPLRILIMLFLPIISLLHILRLGYVLDVILQESGWVPGIYLFVGIVLLAQSFLFVWYKPTRFTFLQFIQVFLVALFFLTASAGSAGIIAALMLLPTMFLSVAAFFLSAKSNSADEGLAIGKIPFLGICCALFPFLFFSLGYGLQQQPGWVILFSACSFLIVMKGATLYSSFILPVEKCSRDDMYFLRRTSIGLLVAANVGFALWLLTPQGLQLFVQAASSLAPGL